MADDAHAPERCNFTTIRRAARLVTRYYETSLAPVGLGANQMMVLSYLNRLGSMRMVRLAELLAMDRATLGHNLRPLERDGLVSIGADEVDRRARQVSITAAGSRQLGLARPYWQHAQDNFESHFGVAEAKAMRQIMEQVAALPFADGVL